MKVKLSEQVIRFVQGLSPEPRHEVRLALKGLATEQGDIRALEGPLSGYSRLRVSRYRIILFYRAPNEIECLFAEERSIVYEIFAEELRKRLTSDT